MVLLWEDFADPAVLCPSGFTVLETQILGVPEGFVYQLEQVGTHYEQEKWLML